MEMAKCFGLVPSLLRNIIPTKDKMEEVGMKHGVQAKKETEEYEGWAQCCNSCHVIFPLETHPLGALISGVVYLQIVLSPEEASHICLCF
jgi:hypothetical protein